MEELEHKYNLLENGQFETALKLMTKKEHIFIRFIKTLKRLIFGTSSEKENAPY